MSYKTILAGLVPVAFQVISHTNSTAQALNSTIRASASVLHVSVETNNCRYRSDGTAPTKNTGVLLQTGVSGEWFYGYNRTSNFKFFRSTGTSKISIMAYKYTGE